MGEGTGKPLLYDESENMPRSSGRDMLTAVLKQIIILLAQLLSLQLLLMTSANALPSPGQQADGLPTIIEAPLRISLESIYHQVEESLPQQSGSWRKWKRSHGVNTKYRAWRGPLSFDIREDVLTVQAHIRYWIRAHKRVLGALNLNSSCGVNEPPRQAVIGVQLKLGLGREWMQRPQYRILPTRFLDRCTMTIANIDVTPLIEKEFHKHLKNGLNLALKKLEPQVSSMHKHLQQSWSLLQEPLQLEDEYWLLLRPTGYAFSPLKGDEETIDLQIAAMMLPKLVKGSRPDPSDTPMPPPGRFLPSLTGMNLHLAIGVDFSEIGRNFSTLLAGKILNFNDLLFSIDAIQITAHEQQISITTQLSGAMSGTLTIKANVLFSSGAQQFHMENLEYDYQPDGEIQGPLTQPFYAFIRKALEDEANRQLQLRLGQWKNRFSELIDTMTQEHAVLDISTLQLQDVQISMQQEMVKLDGMITGHATLKLR